jgi:organic radical activating enzyme
LRKLKIQEIIPLTIQGEGFHAGTPCSFIRLFGCPVGCYFCDTGYAANEEKRPEYKEMTISEIKAELQSENIVITGGEPFTNIDFAYLLLELNEKTVSIETSGIRYNPALNKEWVTLSPKEHLNKKASLNQHTIARANELKLIVAEESDFYYYSSLVVLFTSQNKPVYIQPEWSNMNQSLEMLIELANRHKAVKLSLQTHKLIGVR